MRHRATISAAALTVLVLVAALAAEAASRPSLSLSRATAAPGVRVVLAGHGFVPRVRFRVTLAGATVKRARTGPRGGFRVAVRVPAKAAGLYRVRVRVHGRTVAWRRFRIQAVSQPNTPLLPTPLDTVPAPAPQNPAPAPQDPGPPAPGPPGPDPPDSGGGGAGTFTLVAAGDIACSPTQTESATTCHQAQTANLVEALDPDAVAVLGDNQYEHGELANFQAKYDPTWGAFKDITSPAIGNHEYEGDPQRDSAPGYFTYFGDAAAGPGGYYRWSLGDWTIFVLNSGAIDYTRTGAGSAMPDNCWPVSCAAGSDQLKWLTTQLDSLPDDSCVLAYWHHPRFSSGYGGINRDYPETGPMYAALYQHGAELLLNGHAHNYERFEPVDPTGAPDADVGITNLVVGTGGRSLFANPGPTKGISETLYTDAFGVLELTLEPGGWSSRFVTETGATRDEANGTCHAPPA